MTQQYEYRLTRIPAPPTFTDARSVIIPDAVMQQRLAALLQRMNAQQLDYLVIYADKEHGGNFEYLAGFIPRFEEALLVVSAGGSLSYIMGNENLKLVPFARNPGTCLHAPIFSLPNQPMDGDQPLHKLLASCGIGTMSRTGIVGWKLFADLALFDVPAFVADAVFQASGGKQRISNATGLFISPHDGVRIRNRAAEVAFYEYGANLASGSLLNALDAVEIGLSEKAIGQRLAAAGQPNNVISIAATGDRFSHATLYPRDKLIALGDRFSLTVGYKGGLSSRAAYVVTCADDLPAQVADYLTRVAVPYYHTVVSWLERLKCGITGGELYQTVENVLPKERWHWHLNPGHLVADEEWLCSPVSAGSSAVLSSGMLLQIDIIPSVPGYAGCSIEDTVALADAQLQQEIAASYPQVWQRMQARRRYVEQVLHIRLHQDVLLLSNTVGYLRPWLLDKTQALVKAAT
ncbi:M24 family metallopeptidase [Pantoea phytobeneficialis]|uniref:M24 family metallopeptidase n=1 Tax=Pantoea phytobeneficialis TaxID=2052056 RepID=A0AAP9KSB3_9GAMM|nr:aminopeptidase P family protein [Pantoea phytobeneficialis]MDO6406963.1 M24 family metallopeptidase [Pantoea phytobeneficialis]QGR09929.1 Xaa-Pro aminopeptidase [Pantoea phytobeneficialis]